MTRQVPRIDAALPARQRRRGVPFNSRTLLFQTTSSSPAPYLGKRSRLLLATLSPTFLSIFVLLIAVAIPLLTPGASPIQTRIEQTRDRINSACLGVQAAVGAIQGVPHYMAAGTNHMIANSIEYTVTSLGHLFLLLLYAAEKVLLYIVDTYRSLLQCLIELLVRGVLAILIQVVGILSDAVNSASQGIKDAVQASVSGINTVIASSLAGVNDVLKIVGKSVGVPQISMPDLTALDNVRLPTFFEDGLIALNKSLPTLDVIKDKMNAIIVAPLEAARSDVNNTINAFTFDRSLLSVPPLPNTAMQVCNSSTVAAATRPLDDLAAAATKLEWALLAALLAALLIVALCTIGLEWWAWRSMWRHVHLIREICGRDGCNTIIVGQLPLQGRTDTSKAAEAKGSEAYVDIDAQNSGLAAHPSGAAQHVAEPGSENSHHEVSLAAPLERTTCDAHAPIWPHAQTSAPTRMVVVSDHCIEVPAQPSPSSDHPDPLASDRGTLDLVHLVHHPLSTAISLKVAGVFRVRRAQTLDALRWFFSGWLAHPGMLALLAFAVFGALSSQIHILALQGLAREYDGRLSSSLTQVSGGIREQLQESFLGQSMAYANQVNTQIQTYETTINRDVFGWVNVTTSTMNNTLNEFVDLVDEAISDIFNNTILYSPVQNFIQCILLRKVEGIESALTWIHQNAQVRLARVDQNVLTLDDGGMDDLMAPITRLGADLGGLGGAPTTTTMTTPVQRIVGGQLEALRRQRDFFLLMLAAWAILALVGFVWMLRRMRAREDQTAGLYESASSPEKARQAEDDGCYEMSANLGGHEQGRRFTQLPSASRLRLWRQRSQYRQSQSHANNSELF